MDKELKSIDNFIEDSNKSNKLNKLNKYFDEKPEKVDEKLHINDLNTLVLSEIFNKGIAGDHIKSMNSFYGTNGIHQIITKVFVVEIDRMRNMRDSTDEDKEIDFISFKADFRDINIGNPTTTKHKSNSSEMLTPNMARLGNLTYSAPLYVSLDLSTTAYYKNSDYGS
jgi:DNA-directed RNA polymerase beta subunit